MSPFSGEFPPRHSEATYRHRLRSPMSWVNTAEVLKRDGDALWRRYRRADRRLAKDSESSSLKKLLGRSKRWDLLSHGTAMMLWGLALENVLKAIIIGRGGGDSASADRLPQHLDDHDVRRLLSRSGVVLSPAERKLVERLHEAVMWTGRYPIPKKLKQMTLGVAPEHVDRAFAPLFRRIRDVALRSRKR
jgi:hypothetical protein